MPFHAASAFRTARWGTPAARCTSGTPPRTWHIWHAPTPPTLPPPPRPPPSTPHTKLRCGTMASLSSGLPPLSLTAPKPGTTAVPPSPMSAPGPARLSCREQAFQCSAVPLSCCVLPPRCRPAGRRCTSHTTGRTPRHSKCTAGQEPCRPHLSGWQTNR